MPYIGNPIYQSAFVTDSFSGTGSQTAYTMSVAPAGTSNVLVVVSGVVQDPATYGVVGNTLTFSAAPPSGTGNISCRYLGVPVTGVVTTAYRTKTEFTATAAQTTFTPPSYTVGYIDVYRNGVLLGAADYTASNGTTVVLTVGAAAGNLITTVSQFVSSVLNAIPNSPASVSNSNIVNGAVTPSKLSTGGPSWSSTGVFTVTGAQGAEYIVSSSAGFTPFLNLQNTADASNNYIWCPGKTLGILQADASVNSAVYIGTQNIERMRIDSAGRVTTPYQPAFHAKLNTGPNYTTVGTIPFTQTLVNIGSYYSTSTYRFTAPVAGTYAFFVKAFIEVAGRAALDINVNGAQKQGLYGPQNQGDMIVGQLIYTLAANDYVTASLRQGTIYGDGGSGVNYDAASFSGYLIG